MNANFYDTDYFGWLEQQTLFLKTGQLGALDIEHLTEELELAVGNERREIYRRFRILIGHLLKWQYQPDQRSASWSGTIRVQRKDLKKLLRYSPSLRRFLEVEAGDSYADAVELASFETGIPQSTFPDHNPFSVEELLNDDVWPE